MAVSASASIKDYCAAAVVVVVGIGVARIAASYPLGSAFRPGPGFVPLALGCLLVALGVAIAVEARLKVGLNTETGSGEPGMPILRFRWRAVVSVSVGMICFAFLIEEGGYIVATLALVGISALGEAQRNWWSIAGVAAFSVAFVWLVFIWGLKLPIVILGIP